LAFYKLVAQQKPTFQDPTPAPGIQIGKSLNARLHGHGKQHLTGDLGSRSTSSLRDLLTEIILTVFPLLIKMQ
jgi:hypothetical protein